MKQTMGLLIMALVLVACGDDEPKKKKAKATAATAVATAAATTAVMQTPTVPESQQPAQKTAPVQTVTEQSEQLDEYKPVALPNDAQSGYKAYIEPMQPEVSTQTQAMVDTSLPPSSKETEGLSSTPPENTPVPTAPIATHQEGDAKSPPPPIINLESSN